MSDATKYHAEVRHFCAKDQTTAVLSKVSLFGMNKDQREKMLADLQIMASRWASYFPAEDKVHVEIF